jgi:hypothetical protein
MKVHITKLMQKILNNPKSSKQLQKALVDSNQLIEIEGKTYELVSVKDVTNRQV